MFGVWVEVGVAFVVGEDVEDGLGDVEAEEVGEVAAPGGFVGVGGGLDDDAAVVVLDVVDGPWSAGEEEGGLAVGEAVDEGHLGWVVDLASSCSFNPVERYAGRQRGVLVESLSTGSRFEGQTLTLGQVMVSCRGDHGSHGQCLTRRHSAGTEW